MTLRPVKKLPLWPSHSERWLNCSGQPRVALAAKVALGERQSPYAAEGTAAHKWLEWRLGGRKGPEPRIVERPKYGATANMPIADAIEAVGRINNHETHDTEADDANAEQVAIVEEAAQQIEFIRDLGGYEMYLEQHLEYELAHRPVNCKIDVLLVNASHVLVIDYKHGQGWKVGCKGNPQMMLYALAAYRKFSGRAISVAINQPRGVGDGFVEHEVSPEELTAYAEVFEAAAKRVYAHRAEYVIGPWCQGCPGMHGICPAILAECIDVVAEMPGAESWSGTITTPWWILDVAAPVKEFIKTVEADADEALSLGKEVPGWEMQQQKGRRAWLNPDEVPAVLQAQLGGSVDDYQNTKVTPIGITEAEKKAKKAGYPNLIAGMAEARPTWKRKRVDGIGWADDDEMNFESFE